MQKEIITYAKDYKAPDYIIHKTRLQFELNDDVTRVTSKLDLEKSALETNAPLTLDGQALELISVKLNGSLIHRDHLLIEEEKLIIVDLPDGLFELEIITDIQPEKNLALEGLYRSRGMYCTQCEAQGFRRITYYMDRPDVLSEFETTIIADEGAFPVMLSNGNCIEDKVIAGKRIVTWHDPFKKPCYLFALVAGDLACVEDQFTTMSGREISLKIYVEAKDLDKCDHAMQSLKASMRWDETVYGREYDLDIFMIVAVDDFNMGAMENKGLNIFNTSCVLANPQTTTDAGFQRVEAVVAHEYFHNWSGNRVTCRDWFQLSLKEGFTVYRDAEFSADMNSRDVKRIDDAIMMQTAQFAEDSSSMAHPVRPESFIEISNFYTLTIYEKGAEVVRMLANMLGKEKFRQATDLYFERFDGMAVTCEDFVQCMETVSGLDLQQFRLWYSQAGTPQINVKTHFDEERKQFRLDFTQTIPDTAGQTDKAAMHIPIEVALLDQHGPIKLDQQGNTHQVLSLTKKQQSFVFDDIKKAPVPSLLRQFSAPVTIKMNYDWQDLLHIVATETDGYSQYQAVQQCYTQAILAPEKADKVLLFESLHKVLTNPSLDSAIKAKLLSLPADSALIEKSQPADPQILVRAKKQFKVELAEALQQTMLDVYLGLMDKKQGLDAEAIAARGLSNMLLSYLVSLQSTANLALAEKQFDCADNMTDSFAALQAIVFCHTESQVKTAHLSAFYQKWQHEPLVVNMWLQVQSTQPSEHCLEEVKALLSHPAYQATNPNKIRALIGAWSQNTASFHQEEGYAFLCEQVIKIDAINPQIASRLVTPLTRWQKLQPRYAELMQQQLSLLLNHSLSKDLFEVVSKSLPETAAA